jgi:predicted ester cyclase
MKLRMVTLLGLVALLTWAGLAGRVAQARQSRSAGNKEFVRRAMEEMWSQGNLSAIDKYVAANYVEHQSMPGVPPTLDGLKQVVAGFRTAFPDLHVTIEDMIAEGDKVVVRSTMHGTQKGELRLGPGPAIPPTGKAITLQSIDIIRIQNGKGVEHWGIEDDLGMMQQLGLIPPPGEPAR